MQAPLLTDREVQYSVHGNEGKTRVKTYPESIGTAGTTHGSPGPMLSGVFRRRPEPHLWSSMKESLFSPWERR